MLPTDTNQSFPVSLPTGCIDHRGCIVLLAQTSTAKSPPELLSVLCPWRYKVGLPCKRDCVMCDGLLTESTLRLLYQVTLKPFH